jgi:hypothetical protein
MMPPVGKRANGEGLLRQRPNGSWECRITYEDPDTGQRQRLLFYAATPKAARAKAKKAQERIDAGAPVRDTTRTVAEWLAQWRETTLAVADCKESTRSLYATLSRKHLEPAPFGAIQLDRLRPSDIEALILAMRSQTKPARDEGGDPRRAFSDSTIRTTYTVLRASLDGAVRDGLLARNPAALVQRPGVERRETLYLSAADQMSPCIVRSFAPRTAARLFGHCDPQTGGERLCAEWRYVSTSSSMRVVCEDEAIGTQRPIGGGR